ncbi:hypothetical protein GGI23_007049 [Coemansia sp. RSA 2559]|nr:hypothetical protein GGI23_007049 [Coemansia sp. RSA 2559]
MSPKLKLTKKQRKALEFRGKIEKSAEGRLKMSKSEETALSSASNGVVVPDEGTVQRVGKASLSNKDNADNAATPEKTKFEKQTSAAGHAVRFIAFVGNIPFSATAEEVKVFMKSANPTSVRLMTNKETGKSRGFAFVEFATSADLKHSLKFHHLRLGSKKVNVELTAGGGGNSENRKQKLKRRRDELEEERKKTSTAKRSKKTATESGKDDKPADASDRQETAQNTSVNPEGNANDNRDNEEYDYNDAKSKKPNRRKRGRGARK